MKVMIALEEMSRDNQSLPKSRKAFLFGMAAKIAVKQGQKFLKSNSSDKIKVLLDQADILVNHVGRLKGAAMKVVQTLTVEGVDFLPPEVLQVLEKLQSQAEPLPNSILIKHLKEQLGDDRFGKLSDLSEEPIAAASIGQVYEATYEGQRVIVKVQYPGIADSIDSDVDGLKRVLNTLVVVGQRKFDLNDLMEETRRVLKLETDYKHEEESILRFRELFRDKGYIIPGVFPEMTTKSVLTLTKEEGVEFPRWVEKNPSLDERQKIAQQLLSLFIIEFFENRLVQTDPNPANFLVTQSGQLVLLDFGATIEFSPEFVEDYQKLIRSVFSKDQNRILDDIFALNFIDPRESTEAQQAFVDFLIYSLSPFDEHLQPFDFGDVSYSVEIRKRAIEFSRMLKYTPPPKQLVFLHRKLGGIFNLIKRLGVKVDLSSFRKNILDHNYY